MYEHPKIAERGAGVQRGNSALPPCLVKARRVVGWTSCVAAAAAAIRVPRTTYSAPYAPVPAYAPPCSSCAVANLRLAVLELRIALFELAAAGQRVRVARCPARVRVAMLPNVPVRSAAPRIGPITAAWR